MRIDLKKRIIIVFISMILLFSSTSTSCKNKISLKDDSDEVAVASKCEMLYLSSDPSKFPNATDDSVFSIQLLRTHFYDDYLLPSTKEFTFDDVTVSLRHVYTSTPYYYANDYLAYEGYLNGCMCYCHIDSITGEIVKWDHYVQKSENDSMLTEEECLEIAKEFFMQYTDDLSEYAVRTRTDSLTCNFRFERVVDGLRTIDKAIIGVTRSEGYVYGFDIVGLGHMSKAEAPSKIDLYVLEKLTEKKVESLYEDCGFEYEYIIEQPIFTRLKDGRYALIYNGELTNLEDEWKGDVFSLLVYLD